jgi:hypothetical protein
MQIGIHVFRLVRGVQYGKVCAQLVAGLTAVCRVACSTLEMIRIALAHVVDRLEDGSCVHLSGQVVIRDGVGSRSLLVSQKIERV